MSITDSFWGSSYKLYYIRYLEHSENLYFSFDINYEINSNFSVNIVIIIKDLIAYSFPLLEILKSTSDEC